MSAAERHAATEEGVTFSDLGRCFRCSEAAVESAELADGPDVAGSPQPVALCAAHLEAHVSGRESVGWCFQGEHHGLRGARCVRHGSPFE